MCLATVLLVYRKYVRHKRVLSSLGEEAAVSQGRVKRNKNKKKCGIFHTDGGGVTTGPFFIF